MPEPYVGEIRMFAGSFNPSGWMLCDGSTLAISENDVLFQLIGTTYGGDGQSTFNLPNLQGRVPIHMGTGPDGTTYQIGEMAGTEQETLSVQQIPSHNHPFMATPTTATTRDAIPNNSPANTAGDVYNGVLDSIPLNNACVTAAGGSQPHENTQPFLCINFIISLFGVFPSQT
jgi:microcystin-dependent protein